VNSSQIECILDGEDRPQFWLHCNRKTGFVGAHSGGNWTDGTAATTIALQLILPMLHEFAGISPPWYVVFIVSAFPREITLKVLRLFTATALLEPKLFRNDTAA
jgi:hypothetical protein